MEKGVITSATTQAYSLEKRDDDIVLPAELMHRIQSLLSEKEAARTCVLSKSWLHAWSTIPNLRFPTNQVSTIYKKYIDNTIQRYHDHNIPIESLEFLLEVENKEADEIWMRDRLLAPETTSCLKDLCLYISDARTVPRQSFKLPDNVFSGDKLHTIKLCSSCCILDDIYIGINHVIKCVSLRVLRLSHVNISDDVFHNLLSTCRLLEKVILFLCLGLKTIKVKNLGFLCHLQIISRAQDDDGFLEIDNVPSLGFFSYKSFAFSIAETGNLLPFKTTGSTTACSLGRSVTRLYLNGVIIDDTFIDMIKSKFVFLETLTLKIRCWASERLVITSLSLKRLKLKLRWSSVKDLQVDAPNLLSFSYNGVTIPTLLFPSSIAPPKQIKLKLYRLWKPLDTSFLLKLKEVLNNFSASTFDIHIASSSKSLNAGDVDEIIRKGPVANNVQRLSLHEIHLGDHSFDAFFSICSPSHLGLWNYNSEQCFSTLTVVRGVMKNNTTHYDHLKQVVVQNPLSGEWEALTSSWETDFHDSLTDGLEFKLNWSSAFSLDC
uniref:F-box/FBD/LRR-repeat protein At4g00160-like n=1 Tax=Erigeron canadensis TaxID=72917 RepID=UPI001CB98154|nr:F-box/FBD/LRR-repeat protein At4g00160-like [Erigeron canadensis]